MGRDHRKLIVFSLADNLVTEALWTTNPEGRATNQAPRTESPEPRVQSREPSARSREPRAQSRESSAQSPEPKRLKPNDLSRIHPVLRIQGSLDRLHDLDGLAMFFLEVGHLTQADPVLAGASAAHGNRATNEPVVQRRDLAELGGIVAVEDEVQMEVAIANVTHERRERLRRLEIPFGLEDALGEP